MSFASTDRRLDPLINELLPVRTEWKRTLKGTLVRTIRPGVFASVFVRPGGLYAYCITTTKDGPKFSKRSWTEERQAIAAANLAIAELRGKHGQT
jgi:hypothetical protein